MDVKWPEPYKPYGEDNSYHNGWNACLEACKKAVKESQMAHDISIHGQYIEKDGKRIDPKDMYKESNAVPVASEIDIDDAIDNIQQEVIGHIDTMYPDMWKGVAKTARISLKNTIKSECRKAIRDMMMGTK